MSLVVEVWRHPVKSMQGEALPSAAIVATGVVADRAWALKDDETGKILTGRRTPELLDASARLGSDDQPIVVLPDGTELAGLGESTDAALSSWLDRPVRLVTASDDDARGIEMFTDATDDSSKIMHWTMPTTTFVDVLPLLLVTTATLRQGAVHHRDGQWDSRRFRPNVLIDVEGTGWVEDGWQGAEVRIGDVVVVPRGPCSRCSMVTRPQPGLARDVDIFKVLAKEHGTNLGIWATVVSPGTINVGDEVTVATS